MAWCQSVVEWLCRGGMLQIGRAGRIQNLKALTQSPQAKPEDTEKDEPQRCMGRREGHPEKAPQRNADKSTDEFENENKYINRTKNQNRDLLFAQSYQRIYACGAVGWDVAGQQRYGRK